jgi:hypothetical protein
MNLADRARRIPALAAAEDTVMSVLSIERRLPIADYDEQSAESIVAKLPTVSQHELRMIAAYEAKHEKRTAIANRIAALTSVEPWPGYDEQTVADIVATLTDHDAKSTHEVDSYERSHKDRAGVHKAVERRVTARLSS